MNVDGKAIAGAITQRVAKRLKDIGISPVLGVIVVGKNPVTETFVRIKKRVAGEVGVTVKEFTFPEDISTQTLTNEVKKISQKKDVDGLIIQLPLPSHITTQHILNAVAVDKDIDMLSSEAAALFSQGTAKILPPVAGAIQEILEHHKIGVAGKDVLVLGHGRLVGAPAALLMRHNNAHVTVVDREVKHLARLTLEADIIISGVGSPGILRPDMLKQGAVLLDAGTSEDGGRIIGDAEEGCAEVCALFTPVPGGIGPLTVAMIFKNICILTEERLRHAMNK